MGKSRTANKTSSDTPACARRKPAGLKVVSLFSGCGGMDLGLKQAGHETILFCEIDEDAIKVLKANFPGVKIETDVRTLKELPRETEILAAGFPCIDISRIGKQEGLDGEHSCLVYEVFRLLRKSAKNGSPVPWVIIENVEPLLAKAKNGGSPAIHKITTDLEDIGYRSWAYRVISTAGFGIPQKRRRVILVASMYADARDVLLAQGRDACHECSYGVEDSEKVQCYECFDRECQEKYQSPETREERYAVKYASTSTIIMDTNSAIGVPSLNLVPTFTTQNYKMCISIPGKPLTMLRIEDAERLQGFPEGFTSAAVSAPPGAPDPKRHKLIGNAVTPAIARFIGMGISRPYLYKHITSDQDRPLPHEYQSKQGAMEASEADYITSLCGGFGWANGDYSHASWDDADSDDSDADSVEEGEPNRRRGVDNATSWPVAGYWNIGGLRYGVSDMSPVPVKLPFVPLDRFITKLGVKVTKEDMDIYTNKLAGRGTRQTAYLIQHIEERGIRVTGDAAGLQIAGDTSGAPSSSSASSSASAEPSGPGLAPVLERADAKEEEGAERLVLAPIPGEGSVIWPAICYDPWKPGAPAELITQHARHQLASRALIVSVPESMRPKDGRCVTVEPPAGTSFLSDPEGLRKVLVRFCGGRVHPEYVWVSNSKVMPYDPAKFRSRGSAKALKAVEEAEAWIKAHAVGVSPQREVEPEAQVAPLLMASSAALAADYEAIEGFADQLTETEVFLKEEPACKACKACKEYPKSKGAAYRRCYDLRIRAMNIAGRHPGSILAAKGRRAIGAKVGVYWSGNRLVYPGKIVDFDKYTWSHKVEYFDGDVAYEQLWKPEMLVTVIEEPPEDNDDDPEGAGKAKKRAKAHRH